jgi:hypothetical protein
MIANQFRDTSNDVAQNSHIDEALDSSRNFVPPPPKVFPEVGQIKSDEVNIQFNFRFSCNNSFKILIGFSLSLGLAWNIYYSQRCSVPSSPALVPPPALPVPKTQPRNLG